MTEVVFITAGDARYGFSLVGTTQLVASEGQVEDLLRQTIADSSVGVVVLDERLADTIDAKDYADIERNWHGLLVTLPAPRGETAEEDYLRRLIRRALGYHVRLEI